MIKMAFSFIFKDSKMKLFNLWWTKTAGLSAKQMSH